jgi:hypothetical protein
MKESSKVPESRIEGHKETKRERKRKRGKEIG